MSIAGITNSILVFSIWGLLPSSLTNFLVLIGRFQKHMLRKKKKMKKDRLKLLEAELLGEMPACPFSRGAVLTKNYRVQKTPDVWMRSCRNCSASSVSRFPDEDYLSYFYEVKSKRLTKYEEVMSLISERQRLGKECVSTCRSGWSQYH